MPLRRRAALVAAAATTLTALTAPIALADTTAPAATTAAAPSRGDLYGTADPTYDGVWRQSYAEIAVARSGYLAGGPATAWLLAQQCPDGGWPSYRKDTAKACDPKTEDTNATGIAIQALTLVQGPGSADAVSRAVRWLHSVQNADGGWSYNPGGPSDPDSTAVVIGALGRDASLARNAKGKSAYDALLGFQFGCDARPADRGAFGYPGTDGKLTPNAKATADAIHFLAAGHLAGYAYPSPSTPAVPPEPADCTGNPKAYGALDPNAAASAAAGWLLAQLRAGGGHLTAVTPGATTKTPDFGTTADAVIALNALGRQGDTKATSTWLGANSAAWSKGNPAALAQLTLAGSDRYAPAGADALPQLIALGPAPTKRPTGAISQADEKKDGSSGGTVWIIVGVVLVASAGVGLLISGRKRRQS
ncbi:prenyltransferase/squalene oxidase repeat-containing protein [Actinacidiphila paucisporea]|uniref:Prenyltransferase and squalene oxidase repeat-containing protein n=1 Tax=Actinacidiphila paucisporea TaxID=310782 RepID=A0A1M6XNI6_9ACTN|nr:prenyltransferase/squalene oxidase repeat-containing protein [Actinacidiphila paucisporea]SHL07365.1 Prenyltransferase and squalene oxidase repeat-containing protein [Actinacidiphila paucisporea]